MNRAAARIGLVITVFGLASGAASAQVFNDGGTHNISGAATNVSVSNGTTVNVLPGAAVSQAV